MRVDLVIPANLRYSLYVNYYIDILIRERIDFQVMSWDKTDQDEKIDMAFTYITSDVERKISYRDLK